MLYSQYIVKIILLSSQTCEYIHSKIIIQMEIVNKNKNDIGLFSFFFERVLIIKIHVIFFKEIPYTCLNSWKT